MKAKRLGVIMDPINTIKPMKDTSFALMLEAQERGWQLYYMEMSDVMLEDDEPMAYVTSVELYDEAKDWYLPGEKILIALRELDLVLMRKDPPFNIEYIDVHLYP